MPQTHDELKAVIWDICAPKPDESDDNAVLCTICAEPVESPCQSYCDKCRGFIERKEVESEIDAEIRLRNMLYAVTHGLAGRS